MNSAHVLLPLRRKVTSNSTASIAMVFAGGSSSHRVATVAEGTVGKARLLDGDRIPNKDFILQLYAFFRIHRGIVFPFCHGSSTFVRFYFVSWVGERVSADIRQAVYVHLIHMHPGFFTTMNSALFLPGFQLRSITKPALAKWFSSSLAENTLTYGNSLKN